MPRREPRQYRSESNGASMDNPERALESYWRRLLSLGLGLAVSLIGLIGAPTGAHADEVPATALPNDAGDSLRQLKEHVAKLDGRVQQVESKTAAAPAVEAAAKKPPFYISGFFKTDFLYADGRVSSTDAPRFALSETSNNKDDDFFSATVQHSRLVGQWAGPEVFGGNVGGLAEVDFFSLGDTGDSRFNNSQIRVRQLFVELRAPSWAVRAGQAWDLFSPLNPSTLNTNGNYWFGGNAGFRRPQLAAEKTFALGSGNEAVFAGSVNANIGRTETLSGRTINSGEDAAMPVLEGSAQLKLAVLPGGPLNVAASGLWGEEDVEGLKNGIDQWGVGLSLVLPICDRLTLKGELQWGENTDAFLMGGGIASNGDPVGGAGGWVEAVFKITSDFSVIALYGLEELSRGDVASSGRLRNQLLGGNAKYTVIKGLVVATEYTFFATAFKGAPDANVNMLWWSVIFNF